MANMSNYLENTLIDFLFRGLQYTAPQNLYVALFSSIPNDQMPGIEPIAASYRRGAIACSMVDFSSTRTPDDVGMSDGTSGITYNLTPITFPNPTEDWGLCSHVGIFDAPTGGNYLFWGELLYPRDFVLGDIDIRFEPGEISFQIDN